MRDYSFRSQPTRILLNSGAVMAGSLWLLAAPMANAQAPATVGTPQSETIEEVMVTAQRVESTVQRTPISLSVISGDLLKNSSVLNLANLTQVEPTVVFNQGQFNGASATIRGVSSSGGAAVAVDVDGQYITAGFNPALYDIARVEVLKGPQGTLYGQNSTAGTINIITNSPKLGQFSLDGSAAFGNYNLRSFDGALNLPLGETAALRISAVSNNQDGYRTHPGMDRTDYANTNAVRASFLWQGIDNLTLRLTGEYSDEDYGGNAQQGALITASPQTPAGQPPVNYTSAGLDPFNWSLNFPGYNNARATNIRGEVSYEFDWATLTYLGSHRYRTNPFFQSAFGTATLTTDYQSVHSRASIDQHEIRLNGATDFGLDWQAGFFYLDSETDNLVNIFTGLTFLSPFHTVPQLTFTAPNNASTSRAFYAQLKQRLSDRWSITGGIRRTTVDQSNKPNNISSINAGPYFGSGGAVVTYSTVDSGLSNRFQKTTYRAGVDFQIAPANLIYGSVATSFKDGGSTSFNTFVPEEITAYEVGSKNQFANGTVQLNGAAFFYDYKNQQVTLFVIQPSGIAASTTVNAGASELKGAEANVVWAANPATRITASAAYTDAEFTTFNAAQPIVPLGGVSAVNKDLSGNTPPQAPKLTLTAGVDYTWQLSGGGALTGAADIRYMSDYNLSVFNMAGDKVDSFTQSNASLTYRSSSDRWDVSAYVRNIEDNTVLNFAQYLTQGPSNVYMFGWAAPRTFGARVSVHLD
ncbi:MAG: TonB-dependent receptor [Pseudomonadota bacterium]